MLNIDILEDEDEQFVYWDLKDEKSRPITEKEGKKPICFKFAKGQFYEALDHFQ